MLDSKLKNKRIAVAISGGVDSSVSAALLKRAGFNVTGVFLKLYDNNYFKESEKRAKKIAKILNIPFLVLDSRKEFKEKVIDYFLKEYRAGKTPNPCVICNKEIKFGLLLKKVKKLRADYLATGHYVRKSKVNLPAGGSKVIYRLLQGNDKGRDQSYFLWQLNQNQLKHILFPLGNYTKAKVKKMAKDFGILDLTKKESREICFIPGDINDFLEKYLKPKPGKVVDAKGKIIGQHQGLCFYTLGQRKEIGLHLQKEEVSRGPYYVLGKDFKKNLLIVTKNERDLYQKELVAEKINWLSGKESKFPLRVKAKIRYRSLLVSATIFKKGKFIKVIFDKAQRAITPGQSVVFYKRNELIGGGIIY